MKSLITECQIWSFLYTDLQPALILNLPDLIQNGFTPRAEAMNALLPNWEEEINWIVPPPKLLLDCFQLLKTQSVSGIIIFPKWESSNFWPEYLNLVNLKLLKNIDVMPRNNVISPGKGNNGIFNSKFAFDMLFCLVQTKK